MTTISRALVIASIGLLGVLGCQAKPVGHPSRSAHGPAEHTRRDLDLTDAQATRLAELAAAADATPDDFGARRASGLEHMNFTLAGVLRLRDRAEQDLEAAFALDPTDATLNRSLARFYNLRAVAGDFSKAEMQVRVYAALLGDQSPAAMTDSDFVAYSFSMLGEILTAKNRGQNLAALRLVTTLEDQLAARVREHPDNIELRALAGNFAFFFAGNIPLDRERRVRDAVGYFELVRARWDAMRPGARDPLHCPNTRENFMFELAEGYTVLGRPDDASVIYTELTQISAPRTRAKEVIAHVSAERLRNLDQYVGDMKLMPPWPSDVGNCVVCHAWTSDVPLDSLYSLEPIRLSDVPSQAQERPIVDALDSSPAVLRGRESLPEPIAALVESQCSPCHFAGTPAHSDHFANGEVVELLDLSSGDSVIGHAALIVERVEAGEMPPDQPLTLDQRQAFRTWLDGLGH